MNVRRSESKEQPPVDPRANLFYFLQTLSGRVSGDDREFGGTDAAISKEQGQSFPNQNEAES